jgi:O-antigen/teichoic acid export membrane protein
MLDRRFSGAFLMYIAAFGVAGLAPFILLPFLTRNLSAEEFGAAALFVTVCQLLANFASLGSHGYVSVQYFKASPRSWGSSVSAVMLLILLTHFFLFLAFVAGKSWIASWLRLPVPTIALALCTSGLICMNFVYLSIYQSSSKPQLYLLARSIQAAMEIGLCLILIEFASQPDAGVRIYTFPLAVAAAGLLGLGYCLSIGAFSRAGLSSSLKGAARFGLPLLPHLTSGTIISLLDRIIIATVLGKAELGIYMAATQLGLAMLLMIEPFNKAYAPWLFARLAENDVRSKLTVVRFTYLFFVALILAGLAVMGVAYVLFDMIVGSAYSEGRILVPFIVMSYIGQGMYYTMVNYLFYVEKTYILSAISVSVAIVGTGVTYFMVMFFGLEGAAFSGVISYALLFGLVWFFAAREVKMPWLQPWGERHG